MVTIKQGETIGRYRAGKQVGAGGFAKIYRGWDPVRQRAVALKVPATRYPRDTTFVEFAQEAKENRKLRHPNVLRVLDVEAVRGFPVLVTPLGGRNLAERLQKPIGPIRFLRYAKDLLSALAHAHRRHVLHCDVKPENLIIMTGDRLALTDFGAARRGSRTVRGDGTGTVGYMPPEQAAGRPSSRSDVYAAGLVLRAMMETRSATALRKRPWPDELVAIVDKATAEIPSHRFRNAGEMLAAVRGAEQQVRRRG